MQSRELADRCCGFVRGKTSQLVAGPRRREIG